MKAANRATITVARSCFYWGLTQQPLALLCVNQIIIDDFRCRFLYCVHSLHPLHLDSGFENYWPNFPFMIVFNAENKALNPKKANGMVIGHKNSPHQANETKSFASHGGQFDQLCFL